MAGANTHHAVRLSRSPRSAERDGLSTIAQMQRLRSLFSRAATIRRLFLTSHRFDRTNTVTYAQIALSGLIDDIRVGLQTNRLESSQLYWKRLITLEKGFQQMTAQSQSIDSLN